MPEVAEKLYVVREAKPATTVLEDQAKVLKFGLKTEWDSPNLSWRKSALLMASSK
ncbi:MAG: hypothetical protein QHH00_00595 [Methanomassiliicoccales archaeon]|nr:hypothetical protein [Methanomassiliicoccales archaeon]